jgi:hypothetical protein
LEIVREEGFEGNFVVLGLLLVLVLEAFEGLEWLLQLLWGLFGGILYFVLNFSSPLYNFHFG